MYHADLSSETGQFISQTAVTPMSADKRDCLCEALESVFDMPKSTLHHLSTRRQVQGF